jgi:hypothetical protein
MVLVLTLGMGILGVAFSRPASAATKVQIGVGVGDRSWVRFGNGRLELSVGSGRSASRYRSDPRFYGWERGRSFTADSTDGQLVLTIDNGYIARWVIDDDFYGTPSVVVDPRDNGDVYVTVTDDDGSRYYMIENGGLGPMYAGGAIPVVERSHKRFYFSIDTGRPYHRHYVRPSAGIIHIAPRHRDRDRHDTWRHDTWRNDRHDRDRHDRDRDRHDDRDRDRHDHDNDRDRHDDRDRDRDRHDHD